MFNFAVFLISVIIEFLLGLLFGYAGLLLGLGLPAAAALIVYFITIGAGIFLTIKFRKTTIMVSAIIAAAVFGLVFFARAAVYFSAIHMKVAAIKTFQKIKNCINRMFEKKTSTAVVLLV